MKRSNKEQRELPSAGVIPEPDDLIGHRTKWEQDSCVKAEAAKEASVEY